MKYDMDWLNRVTAVKAAVDTTRDLIWKIPHIPYRVLLDEQLSVVVSQLRDDRNNGRDSNGEELRVYELYHLARKLIDEMTPCKNVNAAASSGLAQATYANVADVTVP